MTTVKRSKPYVGDEAEPEREQLDPFFSVFNGHVNDADKKARACLSEYFTGSLEEVERIEKKHNGIMGIFDEEPNIHTNAYVALVTYIVNEDR